MTSRVWEERYKEFQGVLKQQEEEAFENLNMGSQIGKLISMVPWEIPNKILPTGPSAYENQEKIKQEPPELWGRDDTWDGVME